LPTAVRAADTITTSVISAGIDAGLKDRENDPLEAKRGEATRRIGELVMENELLRKERQARHPLVNRRSSK